MIVFEPKRINQWQLSRFVPSGIIYGRMGRTMRNYGLRIIARPENKHSPLRRGRKSLPGSSDHGWWACRSSWRSLSWMPKNHPRVRLWNQRHDHWRACPLSQAEIAGRRQLPFGLLQISKRTIQHNDSPDIRRNYLTALSAFQQFIHAITRAISPNGRGGMPVERKTPMLSPMTASPVWRIRGNIRPGNVPTGSWNGRWPTTGTAIYWPCNDRRVMRWRPISHTPMRGTVSCRFPIPGRLIRMPMIRTGIWSMTGQTDSIWRIIDWIW